MSLNSIDDVKIVPFSFVCRAKGRAFMDPSSSVTDHAFIEAGVTAFLSVCGASDGS